MSMRLLTILALLALSSLLLACSGGGDSSGKLRVVAVTTQIGDFTTQVGGDRISLSVLLKPNQDAHDFEPEPSQIRRLQQAALVLRHGLGLDGYVDKVASQGSAKVVAVTEGVKLVKAQPGEGEYGGYDPHAWFSVPNAKVMVANIRDALAAADAPNAAYYADNASRYLQRLDQLDAEIRGQVAQISPACRKLVTDHDFLGHYADAYGFTIVGSVIPSTSTEAQASAADVAQTVQKIRAQGVPAIFAEASVNPGLINQVAREARVKVIDDLYSDSLGPKSSDGATYVAMMQSNTRKIVDALKAC